MWTDGHLRQEVNDRLSIFFLTFDWCFKLIWRGRGGNQHLVFKYRCWQRRPDRLSRNCVSVGNICLNLVSLTVFEGSLIPTSRRVLTKYWGRLETLSQSGPCFPLWLTTQQFEAGASWDTNFQSQCQSPEVRDIVKLIGRLLQMTGIGSLKQATKLIND